MLFYVYADVCSLLAATSQFSILIAQSKQLTGCHNGNEMRNATCAASKTSKVPTQDALLFISYSMTVAYTKYISSLIKNGEQVMLMNFMRITIKDSRGQNSGKSE